MGLRIGIMRREYFTTLDGVNRFIFTLADGLNDLGHEICVISYSFRCPSYEISEFPRRYFDADGKVRIHSLTKTSQQEKWTRIAWTWFWEGSKLVKDLELDAMIVNGVVPLRTNAVKVAVNHGLFTGSFARSNVIRKHFLLQLVRFLYKRFSDAPICVSSQLRDELKKFMRTDFRVIPLPIKLHLYKAEACGDRAPILLHVGTRPGKNAEFSIRTAKILVERMGVDAQLVVIGSRNVYAEHLMSKYADEAKFVDFRFNVSSSELRNMLAHARVLLLPSKYEALSYAVLEAFASGLPVVVSSAVPSELVSDCRNGFRIGTFDTSLYAKRLGSLLTDDNMWKFMSENALETSTSFSHTKIAMEYEHLIKRLITSKN